MITHRIATVRSYSRKAFDGIRYRRRYSGWIALYYNNRLLASISPSAQVYARNGINDSALVNAFGTAPPYYGRRAWGNVMATYLLTLNPE